MQRIFAFANIRIFFDIRIRIPIRKKRCEYLANVFNKQKGNYYMVAYEMITQLIRFIYFYLTILELKKNIMEQSW